MDTDAVREFCFRKSLVLMGSFRRKSESTQCRLKLIQAVNQPLLSASKLALTKVETLSIRRTLSSTKGSPHLIQE